MSVSRLALAAVVGLGVATAAAPSVRPDDAGPGRARPTGVVSSAATAGPPRSVLGVGPSDARFAADGARTAGPEARPVRQAEGRWRWPVRPRGEVLRPFVAPASSWGAGHRGIDLEAGVGTPVRAVEAGVVTHAGRLAGRGTVTVEHPDGLRSTYEPIGPSVAAGDTVETGDVLGRLEAAGGHCGALPCLHLGAIRDGYLDPWPLLAGGRIRLLPMGHR